MWIVVAVRELESKSESLTNLMAFGYNGWELEPNTDPKWGGRWKLEVWGVRNRGERGSHGSPLKMTLVTMHLMVIALLLAATAMTATATSSAVARSNGGGRGAIRAATSLIDSSSSISSSTQQVPTIRAPRQRSPFTTQPIDIDVSVTPYRNRGTRQQQQKQTQTTPLPSLASSTATSRQQRRRFTTTTTTTTTTAVPPPSSRRERGNIRAARQPRNTPTLKDPNDDGKMEVTNTLPLQPTTPTTPTTTTASSRGLHVGALKT
ncbi:uncharacterized protein Dwil_GK26853 [Drosophila willistoni]|uniref:Uncharacterized protein n=1 Tax=Drosophila willistoni TaxID=7260 RepID=A0A0Q9X268_DROWI|nr:uncharacterized protein Dwil_GK26853 [Drosophila willistoni]